MRSGRFVFCAFVCIILLSLFLVLSSGNFDIQDLEITGNEKLEDNYIRNTAGLNSPVNIFSFNAGKAVKELMSNTYIESVTIKKEYPDKLSVKVRERKLSGYIEYMGAFLYLDENGRVLEVSTNLSEKLPVVVGLEFSEFNLGEKLSVKNRAAFDIMVTLAQLFNKYELEEDIIKVDVSKESDIHIFIRSLDVEFGNINDADEKLRTLIAIIDKLPEGGDTPGFLDIKDIKKSPNAIFRFLT